MADARRVPGGLLLEKGGRVVVDEVEIAPPGPGEVLVRIEAAGLCHTDLTASRDAPVFPVLLGHEGAGIVEEAGEGVTTVAPGARVVLSWKVPCGECVSCRRGREPLCETPRETARPRVHLPDGTRVIPFLRTGSFCRYVVVPGGAAIPIPDELPFEQAALIGCGVATGVGAALVDAEIEPGMDTVVIGLGGVGLNVVQGAKLAQAGSIIAIDTVPDKLELAWRFGATAAVPAGEGAVQAVLDLTGGRGVDVAFEVVGRPEVMAEAIEMLAPGGALILLGAAARDALLSYHPRRFMSRQQTIRGCIYGSCRPAQHFPLFARWALDGRLQIEPLISHRLSDLGQINDAFEAMRRGEVLRSVLTFGEV